MNNKKAGILICSAAIVFASVFFAKTPFEARANAETVNNYLGDFEEIKPEALLLAEESDLVENADKRVLHAAPDRGFAYDYLGSEEKLLYDGIMAATGTIHAMNETSYKTGDGYYYTSPQKLINTDDSESFTRWYNNARDAAILDHPDRVELSLCKIYVGTHKEVNKTSGAVTYYGKLFLVPTGNYDFASMDAQVRSSASAVLAGLSNASTYGKELEMHDKLCSEITYDKECQARGSAYDVGHTAYGALVNKRAVCDGYSLAYIYISRQIGFSSSMLVGSAGSNSNNGYHAWVLINMDGEWYEVDPTWDDSDSSKTAKYIYYHLTTNAIMNVANGSTKTFHRRKTGAPGYPQATGTRYSYEYIYKTYVSGGSSYEVGVAGSGGLYTTTKGNQFKLSGSNAIYVGNSKLSSSIKVPTLITVDGKNYEVTEIAVGAFEGNKKLKSIDLTTAKIKRIGKKSFNGCSNLKTVKVNGNILKSVGANSFKGTKKKIKFTVYAASDSKYKSAVKKLKKGKASSPKYSYKKAKNA